jgi:hypothetical protein
MSYDKPYIQTSANPYKSEGSKIGITRTIYYGEVTSIDDPTEGGRIKVRVDGLDIATSNENLPWCYPMMAKFFHAYPQVVLFHSHKILSLMEYSLHSQQQIWQ